MLPERCREVVYFFDVFYGQLNEHDAEQVVDIGQSLGRNPRCFDASPCVMPKSCLWLRKRFRRMQPSEALAAQGFPRFTKQELSAWTSADVVDLAGNAFCANAAMAVYIASLVAFP